jgi:hypothetical protein
MSSDGKGRESLFYMMLIANRTGYEAKRFLVLKGVAVLEPALELVAVATNEVKSDHF